MVKSSPMQSRRRSLRSWTVLALPVAAALAIAGCGSRTESSTTPSTSPKDALDSGVSSLGKASALGLTIRLDITKATIEALDKVDPSPDDKVTDAAQITALETGHIDLYEHAADGKTFADSLGADSAGALPSSIPSSIPAGTASRFAFGIGSKTLAEIDQTTAGFFARADVNAFADLGDDPAAARASLAKLDIASLPATIRPLATAALAGKWLEVDLADLDNLLSLASGELRQPAVASAAAGEHKIFGDLVAALGGQITVTRTSSSGSTDDLAATVNIRSIAQAALTAARADLPSEIAGKLPATLPTAVPDRSFTVGIAVTHGVLTRLTLDIVPLLPATFQKALAGDPLTVVVDVSTATQTVTSPQDATKVNLLSLIGSAIAGAGSGTGTSHSGNT